MAKRPADSEDTSPHSKRQRLTDNRSSRASVEEISSAKQLQTLLAFTQDAGPDTRRSIHAFKVFLESIAYGKDANLQSSRRETLLQYLKLQPILQTGAEPSYALDLVKTWDFTSQSKNEPLFTAVTAVLALLLKSISHHIEFREYGNSICHLLLQNDRLPLFERGLSAQKSKDQMICSCLRLLTEVVSFDGGSSAKRVFRSRDTTFKRLDTFLHLRQDVSLAASSSRRKPCIRDTALRYLFANLRLQDHGAKIEILGNGRILRFVFQEIKDDPPAVIYEVLNAIKHDILRDEKIPRRIKCRLFTDQVLGSIATLYGHRRQNDPLQEGSSQERKSIPDLAHAFLLSICTMPEYGVLIGENRRHSVFEGEKEEAPGILDLQGSDVSHRQPTKPKAIKSWVLASFLQTLRPYADDMQRDLILKTFQAAPELLSDYFHKKKSFPFDPKLSATWVGYAAFLLSTIDLPIEQRLLASENNTLVPPSASDIIESILPLPLTPKVISRCLSQNHALIRFFAIKILNAAFEKFARVLENFRAIQKTADDYHAKLWHSTTISLVHDFSQRCPDMSSIITVFRSCTAENTVLREASARLLSLYYQNLPQTALEQKFDASLALSSEFDDMLSGTHPQDKAGLKPLVVQHLINVARCSPDIRWWQRSDESGELSLFGSTLRLAATLDEDTSRHSFKALLQSAFTEGLSLQSGQEKQLPTMLLTSIAETQEWQPTDALFGFLDDCFARLSKKAVKYYQALLQHVATIHQQIEYNSAYWGGELLMVVIEQWPFVHGSATPLGLENISRWLSRFLIVLKHNGGDDRLLGRIRDQVKSITINKKCSRLLQESAEIYFSNNLRSERGQAGIQTSSPQPPAARVTSITMNKDAEIVSWKPPAPPAVEDEDHPGLGKWKQLDIEEAVVEGAIGELMLCLCSTYGQIRKQASMELRTWSRKLQASQYREKETLHLLTGEVMETANGLTADEALPYFAGEAAAEFCLVLSDPLHNLYAKVNKFLNKAPTWNLKRMPSYWVDQVLMQLPTNDDAHYKEIGWLLDLLIRGLRTDADVEMYRRCHILERLLALVASPRLQPSQQEKILALLFRYNHVGGGTTLITRYSLLGWTRCMTASGVLTGSRAVAVQRLVQDCIASCEKKRVDDWSGGRIIDKLDGEEAT
ncbi:MAG: hypothetical protein L6R35_000375 [Caloplaca aegaea]|nr:MAG: hypothetical protein L6R35_000375 [Caloplaca aegaea]